MEIKSIRWSNLIGAQAGICTQVRGFAVRCIATLPPMRWLAVTDIMFEYSSKEGIKNLLYKTIILHELNPHHMHDSTFFFLRTKFPLPLDNLLRQEIAKSCRMQILYLHH